MYQIICHKLLIKHKKEKNKIELVLKKVLKIAQIDDQIRSSRGIVGIVDKVYESSVMIKILRNPTDILYENNKTIVNHKNYEIMNKAAL
jgi:uncharacterized protein YkvS